VWQCQSRLLELRGREEGLKAIQDKYHLLVLRVRVVMNLRPIRNRTRAMTLEGRQDVPFRRMQKVKMDVHGEIPPQNRDRVVVIVIMEAWCRMTR
jgi:hypothetical protein